MEGDLVKNWMHGLPAHRHGAKSQRTAEAHVEQEKTAIANVAAAVGPVDLEPFTQLPESMQSGLQSRVRFVEPPVG